MGAGSGQAILLARCPRTIMLCSDGQWARLGAPGRAGENEARREGQPDRSLEEGVKKGSGSGCKSGGLAVDDPHTGQNETDADDFDETDRFSQNEGG